MKSNNQINVPRAKEAMDKFKMQAASEEDVPATYRKAYIQPLSKTKGYNPPAEFQEFHKKPEAQKEPPHGRPDKWR